MTIVVARAIPTVDVPDLLGQSSAQASRHADGRRARAARPSQQSTSDPAQDGIVLDQRPIAGTQVKQGAPVRIVVGGFVGADDADDPTTPEDGQG